MSAVRQASAEPDSSRAEKRPRVSDAEPGLHIDIERAELTSAEPDADDADGKPCLFSVARIIQRDESEDVHAEPKPTFGLKGARESAPPTQAKHLSQKATNRAATRARKRAVRKLEPPAPYSSEWIVAHEVESLLGKQVIDQAIADSSTHSSPFDLQADPESRILEVTVSRLSSTGDSLSIAPAPYKPWVIITPHALPGEKIRVRVHNNTRLSSYADLLEVIEPNLEWRDMSRVKCKYFGACGGCQYQMLSYEKQLDIKRDVVIRAYANYSSLPPAAVPKVMPTISSPLQYSYRTKITPHFDAAPRSVQRSADKLPIDPSNPPDWLRIGFNRVGTRKVMDIEECPLATEAINTAYKPLREKIMQDIYTYKKGVSLCLRDSLELGPVTYRSPSPLDGRRRSASPRLVPLVAEDGRSSILSSRQSSPPPLVEKHICATDHRETVRERVGDKLFEYAAGSFFQNNNSALLPLTSYVRWAIFDYQAPPPAPGSGSGSLPPARRTPTHLIDAYCGSGLFAVTLAPRFNKVAGIDVASDGIRAAQHNATLNRLREEQCRFIHGDAADIFATVRDFPRERSVLIIDPPRKGTDERFIEQMVGFGAETVVYVSCNVHTQARDVGMILQQSEQFGVGPEKRKYALESLRGFDLFPQTAHVESVAVLRLV
ncbi:S-adenosyl-L-methionine-dependent methyltransferase [Daedalea quercina L-15889]|uniref:S-adenosyl-L-methionine-dependent methyltransferase n=1 Tax=Daedalea quercina L-15889 TaxID=1314783 RepID=A0A165Q052_9APHY|nr:S-adenosyl-L-methionine-dependent methyltransferase [Daedalea quercina L-15889]